MQRISPHIDQTFHETELPHIIAEWLIVLVEIHLTFIPDPTTPANLRLPSTPDRTGDLHTGLRKANSRPVRSYWPSQASSKRQPLNRLLTMMVIPCTAGDRQ